MKFMAASAEHAENMSRLIFTILKKAGNVSVEQTILSGFPDLLVRHPNIMEPWTSDVFDKLEDQDDKVRASTLTMISDLIVKDLVKVRKLLKPVKSYLFSAARATFPSGAASSR
jgi:condensin complex subunit 1